MVWILKIQFCVRVRVRVRVQVRVLLRVIKVRVCACFAVHIILDKSCSLHAQPTLRTCMKGGGGLKGIVSRTLRREGGRRER